MIQPGVFQESVGLEVKNISHGIPQQYQISDNRITNLAHYIWEGLRLPHYISAFSKLPSGGSVFFGLSEQKDRNLETGKEYTTGRIICEGLQLSNGERDRLRETFLEKVRNPELMLWVSRFEVQAPVKVAYHQVHGGEQDLCVIEVKIANVDGVSFYRDTSLYESSGPKAFKLHRLTESVDPQDPDSQLESTSVEQWVKDQLEYTNPLQQEIRDDQFPRRQAPVFPS
ncbi:hypothetical protein BaRGS_00029036 [Batillaria attramentaria]|uniref:Uncharacterized protein n=1 Tax=Batillaria attramentaria TaxID=370345 RepID=A0ABD0JYH6_9CAEN